MSSQPTSDSISIGSFANLKLTAEKLVKEQTSVKTDLEMETLKLKKFTEHIHVLEEKLQNAIIEDVKLKVKQKEDVKLWKGLESKFSSTKALCDQLTETLQQLAVQIRDTEQDKKIFENKLNASSNSFDSLQLQCSGISVKLESAEHNMKKHEQQLLELKSEKEKEKTFMDEYNRTCKHTEEKDSLIKHLEGAVSAEKVRLESLTSRLEEVQHELRVKEDICQHLKVTQENLEKEKHSLESINNDYADSLLQSGQELKGLEDSLHRLVEKSVELDNHSLVIVKWAQCQFGRLHDRFLHVTSENSEFRSEKEDLNKKVVELQKDQEVLMVQHAEECRITEQKIRGLESESQTLVLKEASLELQVAKLEENNEHLSKTSSVSENKMKDLILRISTLEPEKQEIQDQLQVTIQGKSEEIEVLQKEIARHEELVDCLEKQASQLHDTLEEKEQLHLQFTDREKQFEDQRTEILASLAVVENTLTDGKKQYDLILESKLMERSKHLKEISQRNDQILSIQQEHDKKVSDLRAGHSEELRHARLEAEDELRENQRHIKMEKWKKRDGFPAQATIIIFLLLISFITPVMSASDEIKWVTLENIEIFTTHDWNNSTPIVYFRCQGENKTLLHSVKNKNIIYTFKGGQPFTTLMGQNCKFCGIYEMDFLGADDLFDEWELCSSDFMPFTGTYVHFKINEFNATFLCPQCKGTAHPPDVHEENNTISTVHPSEVPEEKKDVTTLVIIISTTVFVVVIFGVIAAYIYWKGRRREQGWARLLKWIEL